MTAPDGAAAHVLAIFVAEDVCGVATHINASRSRRLSGCVADMEPHWPLPRSGIAAARVFR